MFCLNCIDIHIMQEYVQEKDTQGVIDRVSAAVAGGQCLRCIQASVCPRHQTWCKF